MSDQSIQSRYRVVILGGGIHGVGTLHDLASRGWRDVLLIEKGAIGSGTSSKSTKLIHGGLRYLEHIRDFGLVAEGLRERKLLMELAPDLVHPLPFLFPVLKKGGMPRFMIKTGLSLYDFLAGKHGLQKHTFVNNQDAIREAPPLNTDVFRSFYKFYDGQTDDLALTTRVANSAISLGAQVLENTFVERIEPVANGFLIHRQGHPEPLSCRFIINATGPWAHELLHRSKIEPEFIGINNKGSHIIVRDLGLKVGVFLQSPEDGRIFFVLPWKDTTLIGTTEDQFDGPIDSLETNKNDVSYILEHTNRYFRAPLTEKDILATFSGLRWLAKDKTAGLSDTSRSYRISEFKSGDGVMYTIYGGKLTAYRALSEVIGDEICKAFGDEAQSQTHLQKFWSNTGPIHHVSDPILRFKSVG
jgi:glycerol-3-phosphate dehydrogenase